MKPFLIFVALFATGTSLAIGLVLIRRSEQASLEAEAAHVEAARAAEAVRAAEAGSDPRITEDAGGELEELRRTVLGLERRLADLEDRFSASDPDGERVPVREGAPPVEQIRAIVAGVLAEHEELDRQLAERRAREEEQRAEEQAAAQLRLDFGVVANQVSEQVELLPEEKERLVDVLVELAGRRQELFASIDPLETRPEDVEARERELHLWLEAELVRVLGGDVAGRILVEFGY